MKMQSNADFVDMQVKLLISKNPDCNYTELLKHAQKTFPMFEWTWNKIHNSVLRIQKNNGLVVNSEMVYMKSKNAIIQRRKKIKVRMLILNGKPRRLCKMEKS